ncbi:MAG: hypothetical protein AB7P03_05670 [Kofleriaceae bacterium]
MHCPTCGSPLPAPHPAGPIACTVCDVAVRDTRFRLPSYGLVPRPRAPVAKPRRGLSSAQKTWFGILVMVALVASGYRMTQLEAFGDDGVSSETHQSGVAAAVMAAAPALSSSRLLTFSSAPHGATVIRVSTGLAICTTPCEATIDNFVDRELFELRRDGLAARAIASSEGAVHVELDAAP